MIWSTGWGTYLDDYVQELVATGRRGAIRAATSSLEARAESKRVLTSDYGMLRVARGSRSWSGFRDTFLVDGQPVRGREARLEHLLLDGSDEAVEQARRIAEENAESHSLGSDLIYRTINVPMLTARSTVPAQSGTLDVSKARARNR